MRRVRLASTLLLPLLAAPLLAAAAGAQDDAPPTVTARLACTTVALLPGCTNTLAVVLEVPAGWHVYAPSLNDTGLPLTLEPHLPEGWVSQSVSWPVPERLVEPGGLLDHVYTGRVVLPFRVRVPESAAGTQQTPAVHVEWMACRTACVLGRADVSLDLPVATLHAPVDESPDANLVRQVRLPRPLADGGPLKATLADGALVLNAPGAAALQFLPDADCAAPHDLLSEGAHEGGTLTLHLEPDAVGPVKGVVALAWPGGRPTDFYRVELPLDSAPGSATRAPQPEESRHDP